jgi:acetyl-CoA carboxylase biotin carboxyl carrier protein
MSKAPDPKERDLPSRPIVDLEFLQGLISAVDASGIDSLEISRGGTRIRIAKTPPPQAAVAHAPAAPPAPAPVHAHPSAPGHAPVPPTAAAAPVVDSRLADIKSPMVGTFYRSSSPDTPSYVEIGSRVAKGQTLCILEAMKLMNELQAEVAGVIREVCVENAEPVEYGQVLFRIEPEA